MPTLNAVLSRLLARARVDVVLRPLLGGAGTILMFHRLHPGGFAFAANRANCVPPDLFRALLDWLRRSGTAIVSLDEAASRADAATRGRFVCLTFDDGYRDNHDILLPIVREHGVPVTVYVAPGLIDATAPLWWYGLEDVFCRTDMVRLPLDTDQPLPAGSAAEKAAGFAKAARFLARATPAQAASVTDTLVSRYGVDFPALARSHMMSWDMVRALATHPCVEIGAHTMTHPVLARCEAARVGNEMTASRDRLTAEIGRPVRHFAYPFGTASAVGRRETDIAAALGFASAVTAQAGHLGRGHAHDPRAWPRIGVGPGDGPAQLRLKLAGATVLRQRLVDHARRKQATP